MMQATTLDKIRKKTALSPTFSLHLDIRHHHLRLLLKCFFHPIQMVVVHKSLIVVKQHHIFSLRFLQPRIPIFHRIACALMLKITNVCRLEIAA